MTELSRVDSVHKIHDANVIGGHASARSRLSKSLVSSGSLDTFEQQDLTPVIGREFEGLQVTDLLEWGDEKIRDLAITSKILKTFSYMLGLTCPSLTARCGLPARSDRDTNANERTDAPHH